MRLVQVFRPFLYVRKFIFLCFSLTLQRSYPVYARLVCLEILSSPLSRIQQPVLLMHVCPIYILDDYHLRRFRQGRLKRGLSSRRRTHHARATRQCKRRRQTLLLHQRCERCFRLQHTLMPPFLPRCTRLPQRSSGECVHRQPRLCIVPRKSTTRALGFPPRHGTTRRGTAAARGDHARSRHCQSRTVLAHVVLLRSPRGRVSEVGDLCACSSGPPGCVLAARPERTTQATVRDRLT